MLRLCYDLVDIDRKAQIANDIIAHARELAVDPVGNYVVQHVLCVPDTYEMMEWLSYSDAKEVKIRIIHSWCAIKASGTLC